MNNQIKNIWIEAENWEAGHWNYDDDNTNVIVTMTNGDRFVATFYTYSNIERLRKKFQASGESLFGKYFYATDMILIDRCSREDIEIVINNLMNNGELETVFRKI